MNSYLRKTLPVYVFILTVAGSMLIPSLSYDAHAQCTVIICKSAPELPEPQSGDDLVFFPFQISEGDVEEFIEIAANSKCILDTFSGDDYQIEEEFFPGWILDNVECSDAPGSVDVTFIENGVSLDCLGPSEITCTFTNVRGTTATNIPTLSEWGMIAAAGGFALIGVFFAVRRRKLFNS
ncbi:MAG TPA: IPTL-CTERM sorting domain-containing protein [Thermodesulfobacteriota bacterium]|nr:IPTL-CTERM sorting domain-containing protein [Thermodesulfobacteriota bacterium]